MHRRLLQSIAASAVIAPVLVFLTSPDITVAQAPAALKTPWGEPDLQGIWTDETDTPLQRPAQVREPGILHRGAARRTGSTSERRLLGRDKRAERGTELDVAGAYNSEFNSVKRTGSRTSMVVDPPDGRIPPHDAGGARRSPPRIAIFAWP